MRVTPSTPCVVCGHLRSEHDKPGPCRITYPPGHKPFTRCLCPNFEPEGTVVEEYDQLPYNLLSKCCGCGKTGKQHLDGGACGTFRRLGKTTGDFKKVAHRVTINVMRSSTGWGMRADGYDVNGNPTAWSVTGWEKDKQRMVDGAKRLANAVVEHEGSEYAEVFVEDEMPEPYHTVERVAPSPRAAGKGRVVAPAATAPPPQVAGPHAMCPDAGFCSPYYQGIVGSPCR